MKTHTHIFTVLMVSAAVLAVVMSGCNTINGAGKDIERAGEKIQDNSRR